ncbi:hypothetical protein A5702_20185 [Mycobacterium sp. E3339]|nr:hypothetical protein A5702_20185 [Mycobacterium sp. E3339]
MSGDRPGNRAGTKRKAHGFKYPSANPAKPARRVDVTVNYSDESWLARGSEAGKTQCGWCLSTDEYYL